MRILITRPIENTNLLTKELKDMGHDVLIDPLIQYEPLSDAKVKGSFLSSFESIITTSQQAIRCLANLTDKRDFPLWCVGSASGEMAVNLGFQNVHISEGSATNILHNFLKAQTAKVDKPILHLSGDVIRVDLVKALKKQGILARRLIVYKTQEVNDLSQKTQDALRQGQLDAILFFSPRTAQVFMRLCQKAELTSYCTSVTAICLSKPILAEIHELPWKFTRIAKKTTTNDLLLTLMMAD